jgi:hypothetical protein
MVALLAAIIAAGTAPGNALARSVAFGTSGYGAPA